MRFDIITIFPHIFDSYFNESIIKRGQKKGLIKIQAHDLRAYTKDKHKKTDNSPYGGGVGMVMMAEPILKSVRQILANPKSEKRKSKVILFSAKGREFNQKMAYDWAKKYDRMIFVTGRYEGIDERTAQILKKEHKKDFEEISIGPYVLTDGDVAAMVVVSAVARLVPGVIRLESLAEESHLPRRTIKKETAGSRPASLELEYPHYTRPEILAYKNKKYRVPKVLLSGDHQKIAAWRKSKVR